MKKVILSVITALMIGNASASTMSTIVCSSTIDPYTVVQYQYSHIIGNFSFTIYNDAGYTQEYNILESVCISNSVCIKKGYARDVKNGDTMTFTDSLEYSKKMETPVHNQEIEATIEVSAVNKGTYCIYKSINYLNVVP